MATDPIEIMRRAQNLEAWPGVADLTDGQPGETADEEAIAAAETLRELNQAIKYFLERMNQAGNPGVKRYVVNVPASKLSELPGLEESGWLLAEYPYGERHKMYEVYGWPIAEYSAEFNEGQTQKTNALVLLTTGAIGSERPNPTSKDSHLSGPVHYEYATPEYFQRVVAGLVDKQVGGKTKQVIDFWDAKMTSYLTPEFVAEAAENMGLLLGANGIKEDN